MSAESFAAVVSLLPEASVLLSSGGRIHSANAKAAEMLGRPPAELGGRHLGEFTAEDRETLGAYLRACSRSKAFVPAGLTLDGAQRPVPCRAECAMLVPRSGEAEALLLLRLVPKEAAVNRFVSLNLRIDELGKEVARRQRAETQLREHSELLRVTLSSIGDAVIATDRAGRVMFMNRVAEDLTGWPQPEASDRTLDEVFVIVNEATREAVENPVTKVLREGMVVGLANHTVLIARDGTERPIDDSGAPIREASGRILGVVLVFRDVTEQRRFERERAAADRRKDEFLAMLAHELRNPLAVLGNGVQLIRLAQTRRAAQGDTALGEVSTAMERQVRHLARLVDDLLDVSRITTGKISLQTRPVELGAVLQSTAEMVNPAIAARDIELTVAKPPQPLLVQADAARLSQVFGNLLSNAVKFSAPGASIRLSSAEEGGWAVVRVADQGVGIAPEMLHAVFELFTQADTSVARTGGGLGIGLTVARLITEMHGGTIQARSAGLGRGSEFVVRLPLATHSASGEARAGDEKSGAGVARRILVVDDNADAAGTLALVLKLSGHEVHVAHDGETALRLGQEVGPEVILLDLGMPGMDGYEVARRLRERPPTRDALIIAVTGYGALADRRQTAAAGFDHHLTKPVEADVIEKIIAEWR